MKAEKKASPAGAGGPKEVVARFRIRIPAQEAAPAPPVGPALGQRGVNIAEFCKRFNESSKVFPKGMPITAHVTVYKDRSFDFILKTPVTSALILKYAKLEKGSSEPGRKIVGKITRKDVEEIAKIKLPDLKVNSFESACRIIEGAAKSMGIEVVD
ncbi:50S ribosomal protein L11 [bacterium HR19]|nr:50S ribosomal protein L11 [bacterium HR19]